jgi:hypothetical protein
MGRKPTVRGGKQQILSLRTTKELRKKLEAAAKANGRSLSAEVEERLGVSFLSRDDLFGDQPTFRLMILLSMTIKIVEARFQGTWHDDPFIRRLVQEMCSKIISLLSNRARPDLDENSEEMRMIVAEVKDATNSIRKVFLGLPPEQQAAEIIRLHERMKKS